MEPVNNDAAMAEVRDLLVDNLLMEALENSSPRKPDTPRLDLPASNPEGEPVLRYPRIF